MGSINSEMISIDSESVSDAINTLEFTYTKFNYILEWLTVDYLDEEFKKLKDIQDEWNNIKTVAKNYINNLQEIRSGAIYNMPEVIPYERVLTSNGFSFFKTATVNVSEGSHLNLRQGKGTNTNILDSLSKDTKLTITEDDGGEWVKVSTEDGKEGYVKRSYLQTSKEDYKEEIHEEVIRDEKEAFIKLSDRNGSLRFRSSGEINDDNIIGSLHDGDKVKVVGNVNKNGFVEVEVNGKKGYVHSSYIKNASNNEIVDQPPSDDIISEIKTVSLKNKDSSLNIRSGPSLNNDVKGTLKNGESVTVLGTEGDWTRIQIGSDPNNIGYVYSEKLK